jgi:hypothetical protein
MRRINRALTLGIGSVVLAVGGKARATVSSDILGFEVAADWTSQTVIPTLSSQHSEGSSSLAVKAAGYVTLKSTAFPLTEPLAATISMDVFLPPQQPNPNYFGAVQLYVDCPSKNIFNAFVGQVELTGKSLNVFNRLSFPVPQALSNSVGSSCSNFDISIALNVPSNATGTYLLDDIQGVGIESVPPIPPASDQSRTFYMVPDPGVSAALGGVTTYQIQVWPFQNSLDMKTTIAGQSFESFISTSLPAAGAAGPFIATYWIRKGDLILFGQSGLDVVQDSIANGHHTQIYTYSSVANGLQAGQPAGFDTGSVTLTYLDGKLVKSVDSFRSHSKHRTAIPASFIVPDYVIRDMSRFILAGIFSDIGAGFQDLGNAAQAFYNDLTSSKGPLELAWLAALGGTVFGGAACAVAIDTGAGDPTFVCGLALSSFLTLIAATQSLEQAPPPAADQFIISAPNLCNRCKNTPPTPVCFCDSGFTSVITNGQCQCVPET